MKRLQKILAFVLALGLMLSLLPPNLTLKAEENVETSITLQANDSRLHKSSGGVKAPADEGGRYKLETIRSNMTYDLANGRNAKVCLYYLKNLMTEKIGTSSDKGIDRYPYVVTQLEVKEAGYYNIKAEFNMNASTAVDNIAIVVDGIIHTVQLTKTSSKQTVGKEIYLSKGTHSILYMSVMPKTEKDLPNGSNLTNANCYPWANFWSFTFEDTKSGRDINDSLVVLNASTLTGTDVENIFKESTRIEAEDSKYVINNRFTAESNNNASGGTYLGGAAYSGSGQTLDQIKTNGLDKNVMAYSEYMVDAPAAGEYYIRIGAYVGTGGNNSGNTLPFIAVVVNDEEPIKAKFDGTWNTYNSTVVPVKLQEGINVIRCTGILQGQPDYASSAWVNLDFFELQKGLTASPKVVTADDSDCGEYLRYAGGYTDSGSNFGGPTYGDLRWDFPSLYEDMLGIYSATDPSKKDRWPNIAFTVDAAQDGYYEISAQIAGKGSGSATTVGMIVDGATYAIDINGNTLSKNVYLSAGKHVIIFTSPIFRDMTIRPTTTGTGSEYYYVNYKSFTLSEGLGFVKETNSVDVDIVPSMTNYTRVEAEDVVYAFTNGKYNAETLKEYVTRYNSPYTVKVKGTGTDANENTSYVQYTVNAKKAGTYVIRVGAFVGGSGTDLPYGTILVNDTPYQAQFSGNWNGYDAVNIPVVLKEGENIIKCMGVTADQSCKDTAWIGYDFIDIPKGVEKKAVRVTLQASDTKIHRSNVNQANADGVKAYTETAGLAGNNANMIYDANNRNVKVSLYNLRKLMTESIGSSSDKGIGRYPYVVTKIKVNEAGYYDIGTEINMRADGKVNTMLIMVDNAMYVVNAKLGSDAHQEVWKENIYLSAGEHTILYMAPIPQYESDCPATADVYYYPWTNFWGFMVQKTNGVAINNAVEYADASSLTNADVENIFNQYTRIEAEEAQYSTWNIYNKVDNGGMTVGGVPSYDTSKQSFDELKNGGLDKDKTPYVEYMVEAPTAGTYEIIIGAYVGTSADLTKAKPYVAVLVNDSDPVKAQFSKWNAFDTATVSVELKAGANIIRCTAPTKGQYAEGTSAWVNHDFIDIQKGLEKKAVRVILQASDKKIHRSNVNKADADGVKAYTETSGLAGNNANMIYDANNRNVKVSLYNLRKLMTESIGSSSDKGIGRYPYVVTKIKVNEAGYYDIGTEINMRADGKVDTMLFMVDTTMYVVNAKLGSDAHQEIWKKNIYLSAGEHTILYMSAIPQYESDCPETADVYYYPWTNFWGFMVQKTNGVAINNAVEYADASSLTNADVENIFNQYTRIEAEEAQYSTWNIYNKVDNGGMTVGGVPSYDTSKQSFDELKNGGLDKDKTPYVEYMVEAPAAGTYEIIIGAYVGTSSNADKTNVNNAKPYIAVVVNDNDPVKAQFGKWNAFDSVTVSVYLEEGINTIRCTAPTKGQYAEGSSVWVNYDFIDIPKELEGKAVRVILQADADEIHRSNVNKADADGVKEYTPTAGLAGNNANMIYDANNRNVKVSLYNLRKLMTESIGSSSDKGIGRYPYVVTKINVNEAGYYDIGTEINMRADGKVNTMLIMVDNAMYVVNAKLGSDAHQEVWKENIYLSAGEHTILYMAPIPQYESDCPATADVYYYPWTNFWGFMIQKTNGAAINNSVVYADASTLTNVDVENIFNYYKRIEAEDNKYANLNIYNKVDNGGMTVGGVPSYDTSEQSFDELKNGGLNKDKTPYVEYVVEAPEAGTYNIIIGAYVGTSSNADKTNVNNAKPYIAVLVNDSDPVKAQFSKWNAFDSVTVSVYLEKGTNTIRCTAPTKGQYAVGSSAWLNQDYIEVQKELTAVRTGVSVSDNDWDKYLYLNRYQDKDTLFGGPNYDDMRYDFPSLYEEMLGIYSNLKSDRAGYWPYIAFEVNAEKAGNYQISTKIGTNSNAKTIGMIVDGAMHVVDVTTTNGYLTKSVYLTQGKHVVIFTSAIPRDMESRPSTTGTNVQYPYVDFTSFKLGVGLTFVQSPTDMAADIQSVMTGYTRIEAEDFAYTTREGNYNTIISKKYNRRYGTSIVSDNVKIVGFEGAAIDGSVSAVEKDANNEQSYVEYKINVTADGKYVLRVGAYVERNGANTVSGTIKIINESGTTACPMEFTVANNPEDTDIYYGYEAVNVAVQLKAGENTIRCYGVTDENVDGWIGYDFIEVPNGITYHEAGEYTNTAVDKGLEFERLTTYETDGTITQEPYTFSAWIYLPAGYLANAGTIFGNYMDGETPCANFEIDANGVPSFYHINNQGQKVSLKFDMVDVCADEWTNITFTISGNDVSCYKNGVLAATLTSNDADIDMAAVKNQYLLGGDLRPLSDAGSPNARYFKGRIIDVALYDKALSEEEVQNVYKTGTCETEPFTRYKLENAKADTNVSDVKNNNPLLVKPPYFKDKEPVTDYAYSFAVVGDTQIVTENDVKKGEDNLSKIYDWILANQKSKNIQFVLGLGDITDNNNIAEWEHALSQISKLDGEIPYSLVRGNHDLIGYGAAEDKTADYMTQYLGTDAYRNMIKETGAFYDENNIASSYSILTVGKVQYLILALEFGSNDDVIKWADGIIEDHPNHQVIITTHAYLYRDGTTLDANDTAPPSGYNKNSMAENEKYRDGDYIWENLVSKHENVVLVLSGHDPSDNIVVSRDKGKNGNMVTSLLIDPQGVDSDTGSTGMLAMFYFSEDGKTLQVECLSTVKDAYFKEVNQFTIELFSEEVSASDEDWNEYLYLNAYEDKGSFFGGPNYDHMRYDYPSLYENMLGIYSDANPNRANYWPYIAFTVKAEKAGMYDISAQITTNNKAKTIGMIVDGAMHVVDVTTKKGDISKSVYLTEGEHVIIFTPPMPRDMEGALEKNDASYPYMDFEVFKLDADLKFGDAPTEADIQAAMTEYTRIEAESISYVTINGNYNRDISKFYTRRYGTDKVIVKGTKGAVIDGTVTAEEKKVNTPQTFAEISNGLMDASQTSYVQYKVLTDKAGTYMIRVGAYLEGSGTMPYGTILVNGTAYKVQFSGNWNGYDAVSIPVELQEGRNIIQCIGVTADQTGTDGWIGYDFIDVSAGAGTEHKEVSASDKDWDKYLYVNKYEDAGDSFGDPNQEAYPHMRYDYPSLYENMLGIYSDANPNRAGYWPYIAFTVIAPKAGEYQISAEISTNDKADTIGMIIDGAMHVVDVTTTSGDLTQSVYLTAGEHVIIFTSPMPRDMEGALTQNEEAYPWMDYSTFKLGIDLEFGDAPTEADIKTAMKEYTRIEAESISYVTINGNYNRDISKLYTRRYGVDNVIIKGIKGAVIDGTATAEEKKVNTSQTFEELKNGKLDASKTSYVQYKVLTDKAGTYMIRVGAYLEGSGDMPYGTILVNGNAYQVQFSGNWNGYDAVSIPVELQEGRNVIQCIGVTADQTGTNGWIGYDFVEVSAGVGTERKEVSASDKDWDKYLYMNRYEDAGDSFGDPNQKAYPDLRWDYPALYEAMVGIYSDDNPDRADYWPYIAFTVVAPTAGEYLISAEISTNDKADAIGMIVDGAMHVVDVTTTKGDLTQSVYLTAGKHVIIFTSPMPRDMEGASEKNDAAYPWMDYSTFKLGIGLEFGEAPTKDDIKAAMTSYTRVEAEDILFATYNANYSTNVTKKYSIRYNPLTTIMGAGKQVNTTQTYAQLSKGLDPKATSYVQYSIEAKEAGTYMIRIGAYVEGSGTMPYGTILVNGTAYKVQFTGNWNGYDAVNLPVELKKGTNTIQCIGVTADQTGSDAWIGYDYLDIQKGLSANRTGATLINAGDENYVTFNNYTDKGDILGDAKYDDLRWDRLSLDILNYAYLERMPYAAIQVTVAANGTYDVYFTSEYSANTTSQQMGVLVDGEKTYSMTISEFRSHVSIPLTKGTHTLVFTTPMPMTAEEAAKTEKFDRNAYPWMNMKSIILGNGLTVQKAPNQDALENPNVTIEVEEYAMPNMTKITKNGVGSALYLKAQTAEAIVKNGIDATVTPYVEYMINASEAGEYTIYVALNSGMSANMTAEKKQCSIVIENGDNRQVKSIYSLLDTQNVVRVIPVTLKLEKGINEVRITHFTGDSIQDKAYVWNDFDYIEMSPATAEKLTFLRTSVLEAEDANYTSYVEKIADGYSGEAYLGSADYNYIDENRITFEALDVNNLDDLPRITYTFEAEKAGTYTLSVKFNTGLINYKAEDLDKIGFAMIVNGKDKQLVEYEIATLDASTTRAITVDLVEGENEITFTSTLADYMNAVSPRIEDEYRLVWVDHDAVYLSSGLSTGKEAEKFGIEDSSVESPQLDLSGAIGNIVNGVTGKDLVAVGLGVAAVAGVSTPLVLFIRRRYPGLFKKLFKKNK